MFFRFVNPVIKINSLLDGLLCFVLTTCQSIIVLRFMLLSQTEQLLTLTVKKLANESAIYIKGHLKVNCHTDVTMDTAQCEADSIL